MQAVESMHGTLVTPQPAKQGEVKAAVLAVHGAADPIAPKAERDAFEAEMEAAGARWALLTFGHAVHAFTDPQANLAGVAVYRLVGSSDRRRLRRCQAAEQTARCRRALRGTHARTEAAGV